MSKRSFCEPQRNAVRRRRFRYPNEPNMHITFCIDRLTGARRARSRVAAFLRAAELEMRPVHESVVRPGRLT